jgi:hypothetical protein
VAAPKVRPQAAQQHGPAATTWKATPRLPTILTAAAVGVTPQPAPKSPTKTFPSRILPKMTSFPEQPSPDSSIFHSTPGIRIFLHWCLSALAFGAWVWIMDKHEVDFRPFRILGLFLFVSTIALFILALRRRRTVVLDGANFTLLRGKKQTTIPWIAFVDEKSKLKLEDLLLWQRLNIKAFSAGEKTVLSLDRIFGAGLPVLEIVETMRSKIKAACGRDVTWD